MKITYKKESLSLSFQRLVSLQYSNYINVLKWWRLSGHYLNMSYTSCSFKIIVRDILDLSQQDITPKMNYISYTLRIVDRTQHMNVSATVTHPTVRR